MVVLSNFLAPQEGIRHEEQNTTLYINEREVGKGTLYITESVLSWVNCTTQQGFSLEYPHISLHAVSRDQQVHPRQCIYVMVDAKVDFPEVDNVLQNENNHNDDNDDDESESDTVITEMRFAPDNTNNLDTMFQAMNHCQALHPDSQDSFSDAEDDVYEDAKEYNYQYYEVGGEQIENQNGDNFQEAMDFENGQFEDAEEDP